MAGKQKAGAGESKRRQRSRRPARRSPSREPKRRLLVVCEGKVTEPDYFNGLKRQVRNHTVDVQIAREQGVPKTVVEIAKRVSQEATNEASRQGDDFLAYDEVWCVFDRDEHPGFNAACDMARGNDFELAVSNPCFELWLLLHFQDSPGAQGRHAVQMMMRKHIPGFEKKLDFAALAHEVETATQRARRLDKDALAMEEAGRNPTTGVYRLTESMSRKDVG